MQIAALDFEANSKFWWIPGYKVLSASITYRATDGSLVSEYAEEQEVPALLRRYHTWTLVVHSICYEMGAWETCFPDIPLPTFLDTMELTHISDNGDVLKQHQPRYKKQGGEPKQGLSLEACVSRWLPEKYHDHKAPYISWIMQEFGVSKKEAGAYLGKLPPEQLKQYNTADTVVTFLLYESLMRHIRDTNHTKWQLSHELHRQRCEYVNKAERVGAGVDRNKLQQNIKVQEQHIADMEQQFRDVMADEIAAVIDLKREAYLTDPKIKTERGRTTRQRRLDSGEVTFEFNLNSSKDLTWLYMRVIGLKPPFLTKPNKEGKGGGNPSFAKNHLPLWHSSGEIIKKKGSLNFTLNQMKSLEKLSRVDGRWHLTQHVLGTKSKRLSGRSED